MKHFIKCTVLFFIVIYISHFNEVKAQFMFDTTSWCPAGATWTYKSFSPTSTLYYKFSYEKDTIIEAIEAKKINVESIEYLGILPFEGRVVSQVGNEFLYESNDSVYWYDFIFQNFKFIYSFNPQVGDSIIVENSRATCIGNNNFPLIDTLHVLSTYIDTFGSLIFNAYNTSTSNFQLGVVVSKIGSLYSPFPQINRSKCATSTSEYGDFYEGLVCYSDSIRGSLMFQSVSISECHSINTHISEFINEKKQENRFSVYPNPAENFIFISQTNELSIKKILIYGIDGRLMLDISTKYDNSGIDVQNLVKGLYFIKIITSKNNISILKFIKY